MFLKSWGIKHRLSSVAYPQSNGRAELAVKSGKRIIRDHTTSDGSLNADKAALAILQYRNTPLQDIDLSPAQILLHRQLRDGLPNHPSHYQLHKDWLITAHQREKAVSNRNHIMTERYNAAARELPPLAVGTPVIIQSKNATKRVWEKAGHIVETLNHRQYCKA